MHLCKFMEYNTVLIIGNGFDLNLGLDTGYIHFIKSDSFSSLVESGNKLCSYLKEKHELQNWIDIENELKIYSLEVYKDEDRKPFKKEYQNLCQALCNYLNSLDLSQIDITSRAYRIITSIPDNVLIINFNYTDSIDYILRDSNEGASVLRIHGRAKENRIVFGVEDQARINRNDIFLKKSTCTWNEIIDVDEKLSTASEIVFMGYSLGETDHHYFSKFFRKIIHKNSVRRPKNISISYYGDDGYDDILIQVDALTMENIHGLRSNNKFDMINFAD